MLFLVALLKFEVVTETVERGIGLNAEDVVLNTGRDGGMLEV